MGITGGINPESAAPAVRETNQILADQAAIAAKTSIAQGRQALASMYISVGALILSGVAAFFAFKDSKDDDAWRSEQLVAIGHLSETIIDNGGEISSLLKAESLSHGKSSEDLIANTKEQAGLERRQIELLELLVSEMQLNQRPSSGEAELRTKKAE